MRPDILDDIADYLLAFGAAASFVMLAWIFIGLLEIVLTGALCWPLNEIAIPLGLGALGALAILFFWFKEL